jgi:tripartite-type tricarboxylate transporter receptor subunit TctC
MPVLRGILAAVLLVIGIAPSWAGGYPTRPVRVVVGFPAGGPTDVIARLVAQKLSDSLGQQFYVENLPGAGGNIASGQVARATPDGYTIMAISTGFLVNPTLYAKVPYDPIKDFTAVTLVAASPNVLAREIARSVAQPEIRERLATLGFKPVANTPEEFTARMKLEIEKWGKVVRDANLRIE